MRFIICSTLLASSVACTGAAGSDPGDDESGSGSATTADVPGSTGDSVQTEGPADGTGDPDTTGGAPTGGSESGDESSGDTGEPETPGSEWVSYFGGPQDGQIRDIAFDGEGNVYVAGGAQTGGGFPTTAGAYDESGNGSYDAFVAKFDPDGELVWSTLVGGPNYDRAYALEVDTEGNAYIGGRAGAGFPTTAGVVQGSFGGDVNPSGLYGEQDAFVAKISADGSTLEWATYYGGDGQELARDIAVGADGSPYLALTTSRPFAGITPGSFGPVKSPDREAIIAKLSPDASTTIYAGWLGGNGTEYRPSIQLNDAEEAFVVVQSSSTDAPVTPGAFQTTPGGQDDLIVARISADGSELVYCSYFGGSGSEGVETHAVAVGADDRMYITAGSSSSNLPTTAGVFTPDFPGGNNGFVAIVSPDGSTLEHVTYVGGGATDWGEGIGVDAAGNVLVTGGTGSADFATTPGAYQTTPGGDLDGYVAVFSPDLSQLLMSTYVGGSERDEGRSAAFDPQGAVLIAGAAHSTDMPTTPGAFQPSFAGGQTDGFFVRLRVDL